MARRARLDAELVRRGLARSREEARLLIEAGRVVMAGQTATKAATQVGRDAGISLTEPAAVSYVSRGAHKLLGALEIFVPDGLRIAGRRCLDAGASTGGFTEVLLSHEAGAVVAVDVGYGQLAWTLRNHERVRVLERTNVRELDSADVGTPVEFVVGDLSFISLRLVLRPLRSVATSNADFVLLVKPQFEVGRDRLGRGGVVRESDLRAEAVWKVAEAGTEIGLGVAGVVASPLPGPSGNVEYFLWFREESPALSMASLERAMAEGPP